MHSLHSKRFFFSVFVKGIKPWSWKCFSCSICSFPHTCYFVYSWNLLCCFYVDLLFQPDKEEMSMWKSLKTIFGSRTIFFRLANCSFCWLDDTSWVLKRNIFSTRPSYYYKYINACNLLSFQDHYHFGLLWPFVDFGRIYRQQIYKLYSCERHRNTFFFCIVVPYGKG